MLIAGAVLKAQYDRALHAWPFLPDVERAHGLPPRLLFAVGSRETNLTNETGDGGHGRGVFQLDDRWHTIPAGFDADVRLQAETAAKMLASALAHFGGQVFPAVCSYNCGIGNAEAGARNHGTPDYWTTHSSGVGYGAEVMARWSWLTKNTGLAAVVVKPAPYPVWFHRLLSFPVPPAGAGATCRIHASGGVALAQTGPDVSHVQTITGAHRDGVFGPATASAVARWQGHNGLTGDGVFGPLSARKAAALAK